MIVLDEESLIEVACETQHVSALLCSEQALDPQLHGMTVTSAEVLRHKRGKRCLLRYEGMNTLGATVAFLGKIRFKGLDEKSANIQRTLASLHSNAAKCFSTQPVVVPKVYGVLPSLNMWLQEFVQGTILSVDSAHFVASQSEVACALARLHQTQITSLKHHIAGNELELLQRRFQKLRQAHPELISLVDLLEVKVESIVDKLHSSPIQTLIHRDFYFDQVLLTEQQVVLVDLDLCCIGPPELDVGNYIGHLREYAIRNPHMTSRCRAAEQAFTHAYFENFPKASRRSTELWTALTLARHVSLSTTLAGRSHTTLALIEATIGG